MGSWIDQELADCEFPDARLGKRFGTLMEQLFKGIGRTIPLTCGDWAATKAAYRFLDNDRVSEADILAGHFAATRKRFNAVDGPVLVLHDTTKFSFTREELMCLDPKILESWMRESHNQGIEASRKEKLARLASRSPSGQRATSVH